MKNTVSRFREIVKVLASYGFGYILENTIKKDISSPENLRKAFEELGPTFIKIGQILSTRPDLLAPAYIEELSKLQDSAPAETYKNINEVFIEEFNTSIEDTFLYFDTEPIASASVAQVHHAILKDGRFVVVKIQRPHIAEKMAIDISILRRLVTLTKAKFADTLIDPEEALDEILAATELELDFKTEGKNLDKFRALNSDVAFVYTPFVHWKLTGKTVITMENINGFKITDIKRLKSEGYDVSDVGKKLALSFFKQIFNDGFFHGDPHPGNIFVSEGKICYLDFGIMGELSAALKESLNDVITAIAYEDIDKLISVIMSIGIKKGYVNRNKLHEDIDYLFASYLSTSLQNIEISTLLQEIFETAKRNNIRLPKDFTLLIRCLLIIEGVVSKIAPDIKILDIAIPYVKNHNKRYLLNKLDADDLLIATTAFIDSSVKLPSKFNALADSIISGRAKIQLEHNNLEKSTNDLNRMVNRLIFAIIVSSMIMGSSLILNTNLGPKVYNISLIGISGYVIAAVMGFWLIISILKSGKL